MVRFGCHLDRSFVIGKVCGFGGAGFGVVGWVECSHRFIDGWVVLLVSV